MIFKNLRFSGWNGLTIRVFDKLATADLLRIPVFRPVSPKSCMVNY